MNEIKKDADMNEMEWHGMELNWVEWNGMELNGKRWNENQHENENEYENEMKSLNCLTFWQIEVSLQSGELFGLHVRSRLAPAGFTQTLSPNCKMLLWSTVEPPVVDMLWFTWCENTEVCLNEVSWENTQRMIRMGYCDGANGYIKRMGYGFFHGF